MECPKICSDYLAAFHVKALLMCLAHGKGLARQGSIQDDGFKQVALIHRWQVEGDIPGRLSELEDHLIPMHIVDPVSASSCHIFVQEGLQRAHRQVGGWVGDFHQAKPL